MLMPRFCCFEKVFDHFVTVGFDTEPLLIAKSDLEEGVRFPLVGKLLEPGKGLIIILSAPNALAVTISEKGLAIGIKEGCSQ